MKIKTYFTMHNSLYDALLSLNLSKKTKFKYKLIASLLALLFVIVPIIIFLALYMYHKYIYLWGLGIIFCITLGFYLAEIFYILMLRNDYADLNAFKLRSTVFAYGLIYGGLTIFLYLIYVVIARMIL